MNTTKRYSPKVHERALRIVMTKLSKPTACLFENSCKDSLTDTNEHPGTSSIYFLHYATRSYTGWSIKLLKESKDPPSLCTALATLASAVREGYDSPEALAARQKFDAIKDFGSVGNPTEDLEKTRHRMQIANALLMLTALKGLN